MKEKDVLSFSCVELVSLFEQEFPDDHARCKP